MTSHELAYELLALPDLLCVNSDGAEIDSVEEMDGEITIFSEDDEDGDEEDAETSETTTEDH